MALDKLVDSSQLDSDLTSVANAIRAKSGGSGQLAFPAGFVSEIGNIPSGGGGYTAAEIATGAAPTGRVEVDSGNIPAYALASKPLTALFAPNSTVFTGGCQNCTSLQTAVVKDFSATNQFNGCTSLSSFDLQTYGITGGSLTGCSQLTVIVLRSSSIQALANLNAIAGTPFKSGGSGGTIYIPKSLYDHLGDNSNLDYKKATNWSTVDGYGTITWAKIEGTTYETHYADGTAIS